jgi:hypothetical protein
MHYETNKRFEENNNNNTKTTEKIKRFITYIGLFSTGIIVGILLSKCPKVSAPPSITNSKSAEFIFTSDDEDANFECSINDKEWQKCSSPLILKDLQEGINKIKIRSFDKYGRYEDEPVIYSWRVVSGEIKGNPKPYKPPQDYEEMLRRQKRYKKE